jgi:hypothetical protein
VGRLDEVADERRLDDVGSLTRVSGLEEDDADAEPSHLRDCELGVAQDSVVVDVDPCREPPIGGEIGRRRRAGERERRHERADDEQERAGHGGDRTRRS